MAQLPSARDTTAPGRCAETTLVLDTNGATSALVALRSNDGSEQWRKTDASSASPQYRVGICERRTRWSCQYPGRSVLWAGCSAWTWRPGWSWDSNGIRTLFQADDVISRRAATGATNTTGERHDRHRRLDGDGALAVARGVGALG